MMRTIVTGLILLAILTFGCEKEEGNPAGKRVDIYRLADYKTTEGSCRIIDSSVTLNDTIIIPFEQMVSYNKQTHTFTVTEGMARKLNEVDENPIHRTPFAVAVDGEMIYTGYFWAGYSSATCDWVTIDPINYDGRNELEVTLGYPWPFEEVPDMRNDKRILEVFRSHGRLVEWGN